MTKLLQAAAILICAVVASNAEDKLPVKRVVLFKNGVGFFEHVGPVHGDEAVAVGFTSGQLNDVLKSLTVLDLNGGRIAGVAYGSSAPLDRQLGDLRLSLGEKATLADFLGALRGTRIEVRNGAAVISGRLLSIERKTRISGGTTLEIDYLSLLSDSGELKTTEISPAFSVRLLEPGLARRVDHYLDLVSTAREPDLRRLTISTQGQGDRSLYVSYISEVPVWKSTYRLVLNSKAGQKDLLQGWAIVDNVVGEDWKNVELSLVAGAPQSFIQNLAQPYYTKRPVMELPENVSAVPQTHEATLIPGTGQLTGLVKDPSGAGIPGASVKAYDSSGTLMAESSADGSGRYELPRLPDGPVRLQVLSPGFAPSTIDGLVAIAGRPMSQDVTLSVGSTASTVSVQASAPTMQTESGEVSRTRVGRGQGLGSGAALGTQSSAKRAANFGRGEGGGFGGGTYSVDAARAAAEAAARSQALGDLFEYKLKDPITILKNQSALVPIVQAPVTVEKVSIWNDASGLLRPERAMWITNSTGLTLDGGTVSVLEENTFAGEGVIEPIRPGERRLVSYAIDLAVNASSRIGSERERVSRVRIAHGTMTQENEVREKRVYTFRNEDSTPREIVVEHPVRAGYTPRGDARPVETTTSIMRFVLHVDPKQTASLTIEEAKPAESNYALTNLTDDLLTLFVSQRSVDPAIESALREVLKQKTAIAAVEAKQSANQEASQKIFDDQQRLRENIKALKGTPEEKALLQRYTGQLNEQESRLAEIEKEGDRLDEQLASAKEKLDATIERLSFDVKL